jgi:serine/threonine protein kinase
MGGLQMNPGRLLNGRYEVQVEFLLCRWSTLFHAVDQCTGTAVVLRMLRLPPPASGSMDEIRLQTLQEGAVLAHLNHRNIPRVLDVLSEDDQIYVVLDDFDGRTLDVYLKEQQAASHLALGEKQLTQYLHQFLSVLEYLHGHEPPIIHRDLRPHSVILTSRNVLMLAEFGLARLEEPGKTRFTSVGSSSYAAPEQLSTAPSLPAVDIFALGCIMYFLATGAHPPRSTERLEKDPCHERLRVLRPDLGEGFEGMVESMMEGRARRRLSTVQHVRRTLERLSMGHAAESQVPAAGSQAPAAGSGPQAGPPDASADGGQAGGPVVS